MGKWKVIGPITLIDEGVGAVTATTNIDFVDDIAEIEVGDLLYIWAVNIVLGGATNHVHNYQGTNDAGAQLTNKRVWDGSQARNFHFGTRTADLSGAYILGDSNVGGLVLPRIGPTSRYRVNWSGDVSTSEQHIGVYVLREFGG